MPRRPRKLGSVRRSQLVTTYGVGAMVAIDNESFIVAGLDSWDVSEAPEIPEPRLARFLGVKAFRLPPAPDPDRGGGDGVRVRRFPEYYSCPGCNVLQPFRKFNAPGGKATCGDCAEDLVPSRFVLACNHGHLDDFPFWKWVHRGSDRPGGHCGGTLSLRTSGNTASLRSVIISCDCGVPEVSMEGAFRSRVLRELGIRCEGRRPWLRGAGQGPCGEPPRAMQRGSSSVWHPVMGSALSIPPWGEGLHALIDRHRLRGASEDFIRFFFKQRPTLMSTLGKLQAAVEDVIHLVGALGEDDARPAEGEVPRATAYSRLRQEEYDRLVREHPERYTADLQPFVCEKPNGDPARLRELGVRDSMLVKRLREVRALSSFMRGDLPTGADPKERHAELTLMPDIDWLPAVEVSGEGVFLRLEEDRLKAWEADPAVMARSERIRRSHLALLRERAGSKPAAEPTSPVSPRYLLLHTLAHVVINEWSLDGGYPSSALRERLYSGDEMAGILIYTATSDSAGSLGGVVAQGEPDRLLHTLRAALSRAAWCSHDPLCMESEAAGADSVNLAACHACVLLPETSCETNNSFLDRALLVGHHSGEVSGFFQPTG
ncbi:hypothetical protein SUDANB37_04049 [Streptomyces sp. enrichment culture]